ncbi:MAG TPA: ATP-binding protein [Stellaceae bacterium]
MVAAACDRADFPTEIDQLLLSVAANHASTAFRMARLVDDHRRAEEALRESERQLRRARDELETKVAERTEELRRSEAYLAEAQRLSHTGSWAGIPATGEITYLSEETFRVMGFDPGRGVPRFEEFLSRIHPDDRARAAENFEMAIRETVGFDAGYRIALLGGEIRDIHVIGHPVLSPSGDLVEFVGTMMDVTERRRAEEERQALARANRITTMGQLTASIAHEVNQPIATARNNAASALRFLSRNPPELEEVREALECVVNDTDRAGDVIDGIRKLIQKAPAPRDDRLDVNEAIREVIVLTRGEALKNGVSVEMQLTEGLPLIQGDRVQLQQVIVNLIVNAVEAMAGASDGPRELTIVSDIDDANDVVVEVQDTGPGFDPADSDRLFQSFYTTKPDGIGMGLAICRSIVDAHGGRLWAGVNEPRGAVFQFTLPAKNKDS